MRGHRSMVHINTKIDSVVQGCGNANARGLESLQYCINSLWPSDTIWRYRSESALAQAIADGTKPLPEPKLTSHHWGSAAFTWEQFNRNTLATTLSSEFQNYTLLNLLPHIPGVKEFSHWNELFQMYIKHLIWDDSWGVRQDFGYQCTLSMKSWYKTQIHLYFFEKIKHVQS